MQIEALRLTHPGIWDEGDEDTLLLALESETDLREFLVAVTRRMVEAEAFADGIGDLITETKARQQRFEQRSEAMRSLAFRLMNAAEVRKVELPQATLSIRAGVPRVIVTDEAALPPNCVRIKREPDKVIIKERLAAGETVPGAELNNSPPTLTVRIK
jgi:hypothetical protein